MTNSTKYYAFVGQPNTTTGTPNPTTGRYSCYGDVVVFTSKKERDDYCNTFNYQHNHYPIACNKHTARRYCLGMTVAEYNEYLNSLDWYCTIDS